jgi:hypothetical protein
MRLSIAKNKPQEVERYKVCSSNKAVVVCGFASQRLKNAIEAALLYG